MQKARIGKYPNLFKTPSGECFVLPSIDLTKQYPLDQAPLVHYNKHNLIILTDWETETVHYLDSTGKVQQLSIQSYHPINDADLKRLLEQPFHDNTLAQSVDAGFLKQYEFKRPFINILGTYYQRHIHGDIDTHLFAQSNTVPLYTCAANKQVLKHVQQRLDQQTEASLPIHDQLGEPYAALYAAVHHSKGYTKMLGTNIQQQTKLQNLTANDAPKIPNVDPEVKYFPHQAHALAVLANTDTGLIDADVGAGKTIVALSDALVQLHQGRAHKVAIVMPNSLLAQQKAEMRKFTKNTVNFVVISTQTVNDLGGREKMQELIQKAPINTIFLVSYDWLSRDKIKRPTGDFFYPNSHMLVEAGINSVTLDESHLIRNSSSGRCQALLQIAPALKVKRCMTGTLVPNTPSDVYMQSTFLDPTVLGTKQQFLQKYALAYNSTGNVTAWREGAMKNLREHLLAKGMLSVRRSNWLYLLPELDKTFHKVSLTDKQQKLYDHILTGILEDIKKDPHLAQALVAFNANDEDLDYGQLIAKFAPLEKFLSNPKTHKLGKELPGDEGVGETVKKVDEILTEHMHDLYNGKVIVWTQFKEIAEHIISHSKFKPDMLYYDANHKGNLELFKTNPSAKILVAVGQSLREGHNLQMANRVIHVDTAWSAGALEQSNGRVYRPGQTRKVYIDILARDNTADITKLARLVSKRHTARKLTSEFDDKTNLNLVGMNMHNMTHFTQWDQLKPYIKHDQGIDSQELVEGEAIQAKQGNQFVSLHNKASLEGKIIETPTVYGEPNENHISLHMLQFNNNWYLTSPESCPDAHKLQSWGFSHVPGYYEFLVHNKQQALDLLKDMASDNIAITNLDTLHHYLGKSAVLASTEGPPTKRHKHLVTAHMYVVDGFVGISIDSPKPDHWLHDFLIKYGFIHVSSSFWYKLGGKSADTLKRILTKLFAKGHFDFDNWDQFTRIVHKLWNVDLEKLYGYEELNVGLTEYTFEVAECMSRGDMKKAVADLKHAGAEVISDFLDAKEHVARITCRIDNPQSFMAAFKQTPTYAHVSDLQKNIVHEIAEEASSTTHQ